MRVNRGLSQHRQTAPIDRRPGAYENVASLFFLERGDIFFLYRPRVEEEHPSSLADIQRFFNVLRPECGKKLRLLAVGRKRLPDLGEHERFWGFVDTVTDSAERLAAELRRARI